jgi:hypothetical protein
VVVAIFQSSQWWRVSANGDLIKSQKPLVRPSYQGAVPQTRSVGAGPNCILDSGLCPWDSRVLVPEKKSFSIQPADLKMSDKSGASGVEPSCDCFKPQDGHQAVTEPGFHSETQNTDCEAWTMLMALVENAASRRSEEFSPGRQMPSELWSQIITLPASISKLTSVRRLYLYGSHLVRIPPEIGGMANLEELDLYTSYRLHWMPFEVVRCLQLKKTRFSTRALYGNYKHRPPFPRLNTPGSKSNTLPDNCSVCRKPLAPDATLQVWVSLRVGTDVLPLLANVCSDDCIRRLPRPARGYVDHPHTGGLDLIQPAREFSPPRG